MKKRGRPEMDDQDGILAMTKLIAENPSMCATAAFRQAYQSSSDEQSEEAVRKRYLRKFKIHKQALTAKAERSKRRTVAYRPSRNPIGHIFRGIENQTTNGAIKRAMEQIGMATTANGAIKRAMEQNGMVTTTNGAIKRVMEQNGMVTTTNGAIKRAMEQIGLVTTTKEAIEWAMGQINPMTASKLQSVHLARLFPEWYAETLPELNSTR